VGAVVGEILGLAVGVAISPVPIIAVTLMLFSAHARSNGVSFLAGWITGLLAAGAIVLALGLEASDGGEADRGGVLRIVIGALFVLLGWRQWRGRPRGDEEPRLPAWMASVDRFSAPKAFGLAVLLSALNPKNLGLTVVAMATVGARGLETGEEIGVLVVFVLIASITVAAPVAAYLALGERAEAVLTETKEWLVANNAAVMAVLFLVLGAKVLGDGIAIVA
jgi:hypothetical protein